MGWRDFYNRVTEGMELAELWGQFKSDARSSYRFYSREIDREKLEQTPRWRRSFKTAWALLLAMLMQLSPARRVLLLLSLLLILAGVFGDQTNRPSLALYGGLGLVIVLSLELTDRVIMKRDLEIAREIQHWLVPEHPPPVPGVDIAFATRAANTVGGDYYDVILRRDEDGNEQDLLLVMADVAGKSIPAALLMATFQASLQALLPARPTLHQLARGLNYNTCSRSQGGRRFTTAFIAEFDFKSGTMSYINAGHNYPIIRRPGGGFERCETGGLPFGIDSEAEYEAGKTRLDPGDLLLVFTDGVTEAVNDRGEEYGETRLLARLQQDTHGSAASILQALRSEVDQFVGQTRQFDDMTWLVVTLPG